MAEALIGVPGVWMQKTNHGGGSPFVRGLTGNQTLLLIDGIRLNNATYRYGPNQYLNTVDPLSVQKVEVVRGSGSVQYGSDALGGTVQIFTKTPQFAREGTEFHGQVFGKFMADDGFTETMELSTRAEIEVRTEKFALLVGSSLKDFGDLVVGGDSLEIFSAYDEWDGDLKAVINAGENSQFTFAYQHVNQTDVGRFDQVVQRGREFFYFDPQRRQLGYGKWQLTGNSPWFQQLQTTISYQKSTEGRRQKRVGQDFTSFEEDIVSTWGGVVELKSQPVRNWRIVSGIEYYYDEVESSAFNQDLSGGRTDRRGLYPDGASAHNYGLFSLHSWEFSPWIISGGLRLNGFTVQAEDEAFGNLEISPLALVGNASVSYKPHADHRIIASYNSGFRAPNINDMSSFGSFDSGIEVPNDDLDPERTQTMELVYKVQNKKVHAQVAAYRTALQNLITRVPATFQGSDTFDGEPVFKKENTEKATIQGLEGDFRVFWRAWEAIAFMAYTYGEDNEGNPLRRIPPFNGRLGLKYKSFGTPFYLRADWLFAGKQDRLSGGDISDHRIPDGGTPGWNVVNVYAGYTWNNLGINLGLQNLGDSLYRIHGSGVDGYGRSLWVSLAYSW